MSSLALRYFFFGLVLAPLVALLLRTAHWGRSQDDDRVAERIEPVAELALQASLRPGSRPGLMIVRETCVLCHATGSGGAPKIGQRQAWQSRLQEPLAALLRGVRTGRCAISPATAAGIDDAEMRRAIVALIWPRMRL